MVKIDRELEQMETTIIKMGMKVIIMHEKVVSLLHNNNSQAALDIIKSDDFINHMEEEVNDLAIGALALLSPVASDLRRVIAGIKIASELERIGDYAKNIAILRIRKQLTDETILLTCESMEASFINMLQEALDAYEKRDIEKVFEIPKLDEHIDEQFNALQEHIKKEKDMAFIAHIFEVGTMLRNIERAGDHTTNICEHIIYMIKGQHYDFG